jgi:transposase InsO family protein
MTQPQNPNKPITGDQGWAALTWALSRWVPQRLTNAANSRKGLRKLRGGKR